jgi:D-alanyl-D-alanine carboxypeptidase-like protein
MTTSQNGWPADSNPADIGIVKPSIAGVDFPNGVRGGDVETVLMYVANKFHHTVEALHDGWCWGYYYKKIEGSSEISNHASGTAIDLNAEHHPMGKSGTFSVAQRNAIRVILHDCEGVVRWGGDYSGRKDEMHFEIVGNAASVKRVASKFRGTQAGPPTAQLTVDGVLGPNTIKRWQQIMGTGVDGVISHPSDLVKAVQKRLKVVDANLVVDGEGIAQDEKPTNTIGALQRYLKAPVDRKISKPTSQTIMALQRRLNEGRF